MLMIVIIRCEECALCRADYRSTSLKPSNYPDSRQARPALDVWEKLRYLFTRLRTGEDWGGLGRTGEDIDRRYRDTDTDGFK